MSWHATTFTAIKRWNLQGKLRKILQKKKAKVIIRISLLSLLQKLTLNFPKNLFKAYEKKL